MKREFQMKRVEPVKRAFQRPEILKGCGCNARFVRVFHAFVVENGTLVPVGPPYDMKCSAEYHAAELAILRPGEVYCIGLTGIRPN
jgi:hypothetical protein